jgi:hypothetical protein
VKSFSTQSQISAGPALGLRAPTSVFALFFYSMLVSPLLAALDSGIYQTSPGATVEEHGDAVPNGSRVVPFSAVLTFDLNAAPPSLTAVISNAVLEGGNPFAPTVRSSFGTQLMDGSFDFSGDYLLDLYPSGSQYGFDWKFSPSTNRGVVWNGITGWEGGHIWYVAISNISVVSKPIIERTERDGDSMRFQFTGEPPYDYTVEFTDSLIATNWLSLATYRAKIEAIQVVVTNAFANAQTRFFRVRKEPCLCRANQ